MALTNFTASINSGVLAPFVWGRETFNWALKQMFFNERFVGKSADSLIQTKTELNGDKGYLVQFRLRAPLQGNGVTGDSTLEGNEEAMTYYNQEVTLNQNRNAVRVAGRLSEKKTYVPVREDAKTALGDWMAQMIDTDTLLALSGLGNASGTVTAVAPTLIYRKWQGGQAYSGSLENVYSDGNDSSALDSDTGNLFGTLVISAMKRKAQMSGSNYPKIRPLMVDGKEHYVMFIHPYQAKALKAETAWVTAQSYAGVRGNDNPLFSGALGIWDGVIIHEWDKIETRLGDGVGTAATTYFESGDAVASGIYAARALFCGAQAGIQAFGRNPSWNEKEFDYGNQWGVATSVIWAPAKTRFNGVDFGVIAVDTAYKPD